MSSLTESPPRRQLASEVAESRQRILKEIGQPRDLTFVRGFGNIGDHLIWAGIRQLLVGLRYQEIAFRDLGEASGDTVVLSGSGGWCEPFHWHMPDALPLAEQRFRRVIVLPSSFDVRVPEVRRALSRTGAVVFAREEDSYGQIAPICDARLAHDCAFYFDYEPYRRSGTGVLNAFRTDAETTGLSPVPADNVDISRECSTLQEWLERIAGAEVVRTDRAHVMIAAAMLGKQVLVWPSNYHKVPAIARFALRDSPVEIQPVPAPRNPELEDLRNRVEQLQTELRRLHGSKWWKFASLYWSARSAVVRLFRSGDG